MSSTIRTRITGLCIAALLATTSAAASAQTKHSLRLTTWFPQGSQSWKLYGEEFASSVSLLTDGAVEIKLFPPGVLAGVFDGEKAVQQGLADIAHAWPGFITNQHPANAFFGALPGGMAPETLLHWIYEGGGEKLWVEFRRETMGLHPVVCGMLGTEVFAHSHKRIESLADFKGLRHRTTGAFAQVIGKLGATATVIPGPEVFTMLERKAIDSTEYLTPAENTKLGFQKVARYVILPGVHTPAAIYSIVMKKVRWDALPKNLRDKIEIACRAVTLNSYTVLGQQDMRAMIDLRKGNNEIVELKPEVIAEIRKLGREWAEEKRAEQEKKGDKWMARLAQSYFAYQDSWAKNAGHRMTDW